MHASHEHTPRRLVTRKELRDIAKEANIGQNAGSSVFYVARKLTRNTPEAHGIKNGEPAVGVDILADMLATNESMLPKIGKGARAIIGLAYERFHDEALTSDSQAAASCPPDDITHR